MMNFDTKQTTGQLLLGMGALGIVLTPFSSGLSTEMLSSDRQVPPELTSTHDGKTLNNKQEPSTPSDFTRYDSAKFSVDYPEGWQVAPQGDNGVAIVSIADGVTMPIQTDIAVLREDPETAVPQRLDQIVAEAISVYRYSLVAVDGQSGFRIWYEPVTGQQAIVTFVGYGNQQTAILNSRYAPDTDAEALVTQIHGSFVNHSVAQATTP